MSVLHLAAIAALCVLLVSCSRDDTVFGRAPAFRARTELAPSRVAACVESRWKESARHLRRSGSDHVIRLRAEAFFTGITIGVRLREVSGKTLVEYFERRSANALYESMVRDCARHGMDAADSSVASP
jgi:hypothetical protein